MKFSVIIPTCNRNDLLVKCLGLLVPACKKLANADYEIIITDDSKENQAKSLLEHFPETKWAEGPKRGPAANRNNGVKNAKGEWLIFIDDDCLPLPNIMVEYDKAITEHPSAGAFEGAIWPDDESLLKKDMSECPVNKTGGYFWTANVCVNMAIFQKINGFDEDFLIAAQEDQLLYVKLKEITSVVFVPEAKVIHPVRVVSFYKKIKTSNKSLQNWLLYTEKRGLSFSGAIREGLRVQAKAFIQNIMSFKIRHSLVNMYYAFVGFPILMIKHFTKSKQKTL
jgi:GT2 family glycosyltransferase